MTVKYGEMKNLINPVFSIDKYLPKIGNEAQTVVMAFEVYQEVAAFDLKNLLETDVVESLDVDLSQGPNLNGYYLVFIEFMRDKDLHQNIADIIYVVSSVTATDEWEFEHFKGGDPIEFNEENLKKISNDEKDYDKKYSDDLNRIKALAHKMGGGK